MHLPIAPRLRVRGLPLSRTASYATIALVAFAANSLLTRSALDTHAIDAMSFMLLRLIAGAITLTLLTGAKTTRAVRAGSTTSAIALAGYALGFTVAYAHITAGTGALILFTGVQLTMFAIEALSARLLIAGSLILGGVLLAISRTSRIAPPLHRRTPPR